MKFPQYLALAIGCLSGFQNVQGQCTSCDNLVEVKFQASICIRGQYTIQLHDKTVGPVSGTSCGAYADSPQGMTKLKLNQSYTFNLTTVPAADGGTSSVHLEVSCPPCYTVYIDGEETNVYDGGGPGCSSGQGHSESFTVVIRAPSAGEAGSAGDGIVSNGSSSGGVGGGFSLGSSVDRMAGEISFSSGTISPDLFTPAILDYVDLSSNVEVIRDSGTNALRQIKATETLADIVILTATSYEIRFYPISQVGAKVGGIYLTIGNPSKSWKFSSPTNNASVPELTVTETQGAVSNTKTFSQTGTTWMSVIPGIRMETRIETILPNGDLQIDTTVKHPTTGLVVSDVRDVYHAFPWGTEKISTVTDPSGDALTTAWAYYEVSSDTANYSRLKWQINPDGSWKKYEYHSSGVRNGKIYRIYRPWKNLPAIPAEATTSNSHVTVYGYGSSGSYFKTEVTSTEIRVLNTRVNYESTSVGTSSLFYPLFLQLPDMSYVDVDTRTLNNRTVATIQSTSDIPEYLRGRLAYINEENRREIHTYELGNYDPGTTVFTAGPSGNHIREIVTPTTTTQAYGIDGKSVRIVRITNSLGDLLSEKQELKTTAGFVSLQQTIHTYDGPGRLVATTVDGRITYGASWSDDRLDSETDEEGITTTFDLYDSEGRITRETRLGVVTERIYDPIGRITSTTRSSGGLSLSNSRGYDVSGRSISETAPNGLASTTAYTLGGRVTTVTRPDTSTEITTRYLDGQTESVTGTGIVARFFDYGKDANGLWTKQLVASAASQQFSQSWTNTRGEVWRAAESGPTGLIISTTTFASNYVGRPLSRTVPGEATILYAYDPDSGALFREARDLNANGVIDEATDSISDTVTSYVEANGAWYRQNVQSVFQTDGNAIPTTLSTTRAKLTGLGAGVASVVELIDSQENKTTRTTSINRATQTVTTTTDVPVSNLDAVEITVAGNLVSTTTSTVSQPTNYTGYDALKRLTGTTSPFGVVSSVVYHPTTGQVLSTTTAGKATSYTYHPNGSLGAGKIATTTLPDTKVIRKFYTLRGEEFRVWGGATYPLERVYDAHGRLEYLKTYRGGTGWDSATWPAAPGTADTTGWTYYPASGLLYRKTDADNKFVTYDYYAASGKLKTRQRAWGALTTYTWSLLGLPENTTHTDGTPPVSRTYDRSGRPKTLVDAAGTHNYSYPDQLTVTEAISGGILDKVTRTAVLDSFGRPSSNSASSGTAVHSVGYTYRPDSRLDQVFTGTDSATYSYLAASDAIENLVFKSGATTRLSTLRAYDTSDRLEGVTHTYDGAKIQSFGVTEFDSMHRRKKITREDGTRWDFGYNPKGEVTSGVRKKTSTGQNIPGWDYGYDFDEIGNRKTTATNGRTSTYGANSLNELTTRTIPRAFDIVGKAASGSSVTVNSQAATRLDGWFSKELTTANPGNILIPYSVTATDGTGTTTRSGGKFLPATPETFIHDDDGNLISDGRFIYTWDAENRLIAMESHPAVPLAARRKLAFSYDAMGRRVNKTVWHGTSNGGWQLHHKFDFIHESNGWNILAERSGGSVNHFLRTYAWGADLSGNRTGAGGVGGLLFATLHTSNKTFAYGMDLNGNVTLLVDTATGQAAATYDYGPFGEPLRQSGEYANLNPYRFSTKYTDDETGLLDYGYRYYNSVTGRWLSRDPIEERGGINLYGFVGNDGIGRWDYLGQWTLGEARSSLKSEGVTPAIPESQSYNPYTGYSTNPARYSDQQVFDKWVELEKIKGNGWYQRLPKCPAKLCMKNRKPVNPDDKVWKKLGRPSGSEASLHPGISWSMRSDPEPGGGSNQCTYHEWGELVRDAPGAGTVDWFSPGEGGRLGHYAHDVAPILLANHLDGGGNEGLITTLINSLVTVYAIRTPVGSNVKNYLNVRPLWAENK